MALFKGLFGAKRTGKRVTDKVMAKQSTAFVSRLSYQVANLQMIGTRENQEDSFAVINSMDVTEIIRSGLFGIVADGMGGMRDGKLISEAAVTEFITLFHSLDRSGDIPVQLYEGVIDINRELFDKFKGMGGTTAVIVMLYNERLYWASIGDSAIFLKRDGGLFRLNKEHTYLNQLYMEELYSETVDKEAADSDVDGVRLSGFLGIDKLDEVDYNIKPFLLRPGDTFLLCSDGISGVLPDEEILGALCYDPPEACARLNDAVVRKGNPNQDNYTGLIIQCKQ